MSGRLNERVLCCPAMFDLHEHGSSLRFVQRRAVTTGSNRLPVLCHASPFCKHLNWLRGKDVTGLALVPARHTLTFPQCPCNVVIVPDDDDPDDMAVREMAVNVHPDVLRDVPSSWWIPFDHELITDGGTDSDDSDYGS